MLYECFSKINQNIVNIVVRIAYFGTDGCPGHHVIPIRGKFTEEDIKVIESVDCDDFYKVFDVMRFKIAEFLWGLYCRIKKV